MNFYAIRDTKTGKFNRPFPSESDEDAKRTFAQTVNSKDQGNLAYTHSSDFQLFSVSRFCDETGDMIGYEDNQAHLMINGSDVRIPDTPESEIITELKTLIMSLKTN